MKNLIHLISDDTYRSIGIGMVVGLVVLIAILCIGYLILKIIDLYVYVLYGTQLIHHWCYYIKRRRWPTDKLREIYMERIGKNAKKQILKYRLRNMKDATKAVQSGL